MTRQVAHFRLRPLTAAILVALVHQPVHATAVSWVPDADGLWSTAANWNPAAQPTAADDVTIDVGGATVRTITINAASTAHSLLSQETIALTGGTLTLAAASTINGDFLFSGGTLNGAGTLTMNGAGSSWTAGQMSDAGVTLNSGTLAVSGNGVRDMLSGRTLRNTGTVNWSNTAAGGARFRTGGGALIDNQGQWNDNNAFDNGISNDFGGAASKFTKSGTYTKAGAGATNIGIAFNNS